VLQCQRCICSTLAYLRGISLEHKATRVRGEPPSLEDAQYNLQTVWDAIDDIRNKANKSVESNELSLQLVGAVDPALFTQLQIGDNEEMVYTQAFVAPRGITIINTVDTQAADEIDWAAHTTNLPTPDGLLVE
jgi:hypothetical protein